MPNKSGRAWKLTRASVHRKGAPRTKTNKYSHHDTDFGKRPAAGSRSRVWVGGYTRADGTRVEGHYRNARRNPRGGRRSASRQAA